MLNSFLDNFKCQKGCGKQFTHTRIPDENLNIYPGCWAIPKDKMNEFYTLYHKKVFINKEKEYLTERQKRSGGPILVDFDFRFGTHHDERQYDVNHITDIIDLYLCEIEELFIVPENVEVPIFILEKKDIQKCKDIVKDGIHLIIGISTDHTIQQLLRKHVLSETLGTDHHIADVLDDLSLVNSHEDVLDFGISKGHTNWQLFGSQKPGKERYNLTRYLICKWDSNGKSWDWEEQNISDHSNLEYLKIMSAQNTSHPKFQINPKYQSSYESFKKSSLIKKSKKFKKMKHEEIQDIQMLKQACNHYLENLPNEKYEMKETHEFVMALPENYYNNQPEWIRVGWACYNTDKKMFPTWMLFSSQSSKFDFSDIPKYYQTWKKMKRNGDRILTNRSIMYWLKESNRAEYEKIKKKTVEHYIENVIDTPTEVDIAELLYQMFKDKYACVSIEKKIWYEFSQHRWQREDSGNSLRQKISRVLTTKFKELNTRYVPILSKLESESTGEGTHADKVNTLSEKIKKCSKISIILKKTTYKNNIMREAAEIFYDKHFFQKLDQNPYLLSCENGVIDFNAETIDTIFRKGKPEDYLSLNTRVNYIDDKKKSKNRKEIINFMEQLFPIPELNKYMWDHLASTLLGTNQNQTFNIYTGEGRNGKTKLVELMALVLGDYKGSVPISLVTQRRSGIGGVSPEVAQLMGKRYAVMQEPSKGDKINEGIMKEITGGDPITARLLFQNSITFTPQFKLAVCTNNLFDIKSDDNGTWRRIRVCPFISHFNEDPYKIVSKTEKPYQFLVNKNIDKEKFPIWKETFFKMLVERAFQTKGNVEDCKTVLLASNEYREDQNSISQFIYEMLDEDVEGVIRFTAIWELLTEWWKDNGKGARPKQKELKKILKRKYGSPHSDKMYHGIKQKSYTNIDKLDF